MKELEEMSKLAKQSLQAKACNDGLMDVIDCDAKLLGHAQHLHLAFDTIYMYMYIYIYMIYDDVEALEPASKTT